MAALRITSGSLFPGVQADRFRLPPGTAIRYERPAEPLVGFFTAYIALDLDRAVYRNVADWMLPAWGRLCFHVDCPPFSVSIRGRTFPLVDPGVLYGVTSQAVPVDSNGGLSVMLDVTPLGWARFLPVAADAMRDQVVSLDRVLPGWAEEVVDGMRDTDQGLGIKPFLDRFLLDRLLPPSPDEPLVQRIMALLVDPATRDLASAAADLGISYQTLLRITKRYFGFAPKLLLRRARLLRTIAPMLAEERMPGPLEVPPGYHDASHFIRDANHFLGMTPRRFLSMDLPYLRAGLRARAMVAGALTPSLDPPAHVALGTAA